jgi:hypothetical protein
VCVVWAPRVDAERAHGQIRRVFGASRGITYGHVAHEMEKGLVGGFRFSGITLLDEIIGQYEKEYILYLALMLLWRTHGRELKLPPRFKCILLEKGIALYLFLR